MQAMAESTLRRELPPEPYRTTSAYTAPATLGWTRINPSLLAANGGVAAAGTHTPNTTPGLIGSNPYVYGPHWFNDDLSINKSIPIRESLRTTLSQLTTLVTTARRIEIRANIEF
jgi:hypothetical protein